MACPVAYTNPKESYSKKNSVSRKAKQLQTRESWAKLKKFRKATKSKLWNNILTMIYKISRNSKAIKAILTNVFKIPEIFT